MTHHTTRTTLDLSRYSPTPEALRRAALSDEWLGATPERQVEIIAEWKALDAGTMRVMGAKK